MRASGRFWENGPEHSPKELKDFQGGQGWVAHHTESFSDAASMIRNGLLSRIFRKRIEKSSEPKREDPIFKFVKVTRTSTPLGGYDYQSRFGPIRILISGKVKVEETPSPIKLWRSVVKNRIAPREIAAVIVPERNSPSMSYQFREYNQKLELLLDAAKEKEIPVYGLSGKRLWPPVPQEK